MSGAWLNWLLLLTLVMMWGTSFLFTALALDSFTPLLITELRLMLGALTLLVLVWLKGLRVPLGTRNLAIFLLLGAVGNAVPFLLIAWGQQQVPSSTAGTLMAVMPLMTLVLAHFVIPGERLTPTKILGALVGFVGVVLLLQPQQAQSLTHELAILLAACCYAVNVILVRKLAGFHPLVGAAAMLSAASLLLLPFFVYNFQSVKEISSTSLLSLVWLGIVPTGLASLVYFVIVTRAGPSFLANINFMIPVVAFVTGIALLAEPFSTSSVAALLMIMLGIMLTRYRLR